MPRPPIDLLSPTQKYPHGLSKILTRLLVISFLTMDLAKRATWMDTFGGDVGARDVAARGGTACCVEKVM